MELKNGQLNLKSDLDNEQIEALVPKILKKINKIETVVVDGSNIASSALFSLLYAIKKEKESVEIALLNDSHTLDLLGNATFIHKR